MVLDSFLAAAVQAEPVYFNLEAAVDKTVVIIDQAGAAGVKLLAFPKTWVGGYPYWIWSMSPVEALALSRRYHENSIRVQSPQMTRIIDAVRRNGLYCVVGTSEQDFGSLYIGQSIIGPDGAVIAHRRKLKPTHVERAVFGEGDGSDLAVHDTAIGRLGALSCWEHLQPLVKQAMFSQFEQVHVAAWPSLTPSEGGPTYALSAEVNCAVNRVYAAEGQCFVVAATQVLTERIGRDHAEHFGRDVPFLIGGGCSMIYGPNGQPLARYLDPAEEGLVLAEIDCGLIASSKALADPVGHYARSDVLRLQIDRSSRRTIEIQAGDPRPSAPEAAPEPGDQ